MTALVNKLQKAFSNLQRIINNKDVKIRRLQTIWFLPYTLLSSGIEPVGTTLRIPVFSLEAELVEEMG